MALVAQNSIEQSRPIRPRNRNQPITSPNPNPRPPPSTLFSSIFSSPSTTINNTHNNASSGLPYKTNKFALLAFNKLGCGSLSPASVPEVIRSAADWEGKKVRTQKRRRKKKRSSVQALKKTTNNGDGNGNGNATSPVVVVDVVSDVFCAPPGIGRFSSDAAFVDCVEPRRPVAPRNHRKNMTTEGRLRLESVLDGFDRFGELRLDVDNMSYEELVDLSDKIGYVGTGLREEKILRCLRKAKLLDSESIPLLPPMDPDCKCSICRDEYEADDDVGKLDCGHCYHIGCIKPWLLQKNSCPICKAAADNGTNCIS